MKQQYRRTHTIGQVELWRHPKGHRFIRFTDSPMQGHEIPLPKNIPKKDHDGVNFVTNFTTEVSGVNQRVWAKDAEGKFDYESLGPLFKEQKKAFNRSTHHARMLKQLRAAGHLAPEALGILHPKRGTPLLLTTHIEGNPNNSREERKKLENKLKKSGFDPHDLHSDNVFEIQNGERAVIDASLFGPTDKQKLKQAIKKENKRKRKLIIPAPIPITKSRGFIQRILDLFRRI